jgi:2-C-methyl-D-erythritol 2,4-cyclodiphosphate synthase
MKKIRVGEGWDVHALVEGRPLIMGGIEVPFHLGLLGHSDADVLAHAIIDSLLGAAAIGDIGRHYSDKDPQFKGADSMVLLADSVEKIKALGWTIGNIDSTIICQAPKLANFIPLMQKRLAQVMQIDEQDINVKAKTAEKMGPVGEGKAIEARSVCLLFKN